jgi:hypothetical protein
MNKEEMKHLLDQIIEMKYQVNTFFYEDPVRPLPGRPASEQDLDQLEGHLTQKGLKAPTDYRLFLSVYNGIKDVLGPAYSLLSLQDVIAEQHGIIEELAEEFPSCVKFVIGAGNTPELTGFDVSTSPEDGNYEVTWISAEANEWRSKNFQDFLVKYLALLERRVSLQKKDRENLKP